MNASFLFGLKLVISAALIASVSSLAGKKPFLAGFLIALPLTSILTLCWSYFEFRDMDKLNSFAVSILTSVPLSLLFFVPFVLNRWLKMGFPLTMAAGLGLLWVAYLIQSAIFPTK